MTESLAERLKRRREEANKKELNGHVVAKGVIWGKDVKPRDIDWLWWPRLACAQINLIAGLGGHGKGLVCADIAARVSRDVGRWPVTNEAVPYGGTIMWCECEDPVDAVLYQRLVAAGADINKVCFFDRQTYAETDLKEFILKNNVRLIVLSPLLSFLPELKNKNDEMEVRGTLERLQYAIEGTLCSALGICHLNKRGDLSAVERILGAVSFPNFTRNVFGVNASDNEDTGKKEFRLAHLKHNISDRAKDLVAQPINRSEDPRGQFWALDWTEAEENVDASRLFEPRRIERDGDKKIRRGSAVDWLLNFLERQPDHSAPLAVIYREGSDAGHSEGSLKQARSRSENIESHGTGEGLVWRLVF